MEEARKINKAKEEQQKLKAKEVAEAMKKQSAPKLSASKQEARGSK